MAGQIITLVYENTMEMKNSLTGSFFLFLDLDKVIAECFHRLHALKWKIMYAPPPDIRLITPSATRRDNSYIGLGVGGIISHTYRVFVTAIPH